MRLHLHIAALLLAVTAFSLCHAALEPSDENDIKDLQEDVDMQPNQLVADTNARNTDAQRWRRRWWRRRYRRRWYRRRWRRRY